MVALQGLNRNHGGHKDQMRIRVGAIIFFCVTVLLPTFLFGQAQTTQAQPTQAPTPAQPTPEQIAWRKAEDARLHTDWAYLGKYREANAKLPPPAKGEQRIVFMGDSITEGWGKNPVGNVGEFFPGKPYVNRGISGQTTPQMLVRLRPDVIDLQPFAMVLLAGINDIAENTGPMPLSDTEGNIQSMVELARAHGIRVILCGLTPAKSFLWRPSINPAPKVLEFNSWIKSYAAAEHIPFVDYYSLLVDSTGAFPSDLSYDGVHPTAKGYSLMQTAVEKAIAQLSKEK